MSSLYRRAGIIFFLLIILIQSGEWALARDIRQDQNPVAAIAHRIISPAADHDITILSETQWGMTIELTLPPFQLKSIAEYAAVYQRIYLPGWAKTTQQGAPELPVKGVLIKVPQTGDLKVSVLNNEYETINDCLLYPVPKTKITDDYTGIITEFIKNEKIYTCNKFLPGAVNELCPREFFGRTTIARLMLYPFQYNPRRKKLLFSRKIRLQISFEFPLLSAEYECQDEHNIDLQDILMPQVARKKNNVREQPEAIKIEITREGIYHLPASTLSEAGLDLEGIDPATFRLHNQGREVAIKVISETTIFEPGDYIEFFGQAIDTRFTGTNVYWLFWGDGAGKSIGQIEGQVVGQAEKRIDFFEALCFEENHTMWEATPGAPEEDYRFW